MNRRLPHDAFQFYLGLGAGRSYQQVADRFGVSKRAVTKLAVRDDWQRRIDELERASRERTEQKVLESLEDMNARHLRSLRAVQGKALEALRSMRLSTAMEAVRSLDLAIKQERLIRGEPSERAAISLEETIRREYERWMVPAEDDGDGEEEDDAR